MNKKITFIADFFLDEIFGGAELVNEEIIKELEKLGYQVSRVKCPESRCAAPSAPCSGRKRHLTLRRDD